MRLSIGRVLFMIAAMIGAVFIGLLLPLMPVKVSLLGVGALLVVAGIVIVLMLPDRASPPYRLILAVLALAVFTRFLWPNFAYIPIPALPTKNPQRLVWAIAIAYWFYSLATNGELRERLGRRCRQSGIVWLVAALFALRVISVVFSLRPMAGLLPIILEFFEYLPALLFALTWVRGQEDALKIGRWLMLATLVIVGLTVVEVIRQQNVFMNLIPRDASNEEFLSMALESKMRGGGYRAQASFNHPLLLAQFIAVMLPLLLLSARLDPSALIRRLSVFALCCTPFVLWASRTRTGLAVALVVAGILLFAFSFNLARGNRRGDGGRSSLVGALLATTLVGVAAVAAVFVLQLAKGRTAEESVSSGARVEMLSRSMKAVTESPVVGFGPGMGAPLAANTNSRGRTTLDSYVLVLMLDSGIPALLVFAALLAAAATRMPLLFGARPEAQQTTAAWALSVVAFGLTALVLGTPHNLPLLFLALGVIVALDDRSQLAKAETAAQHPRTAWAVSR